jgi:hypothetical protein
MRGSPALMQKAFGTFIGDTHGPTGDLGSSRESSEEPAIRPWFPISTFGTSE